MKIHKTFFYCSLTKTFKRSPNLFLSCTSQNSLNIHQTFSYCALPKTFWTFTKPFPIVHSPKPLNIQQTVFFFFSHQNLLNIHLNFFILHTRKTLNVHQTVFHCALLNSPGIFTKNLPLCRLSAPTSWWNLTDTGRRRWLPSWRSSPLSLQSAATNSQVELVHNFLNRFARNIKQMCVLTINVEDQGFKPSRGLTLLPPSRGVVLWLDHAGDSVHSIVIYLTYMTYVLYTANKSIEW